jgi:hypothetical protein
MARKCEKARRVKEVYAKGGERALITQVTTSYSRLTYDSASVFK